MKRGKIVVIVAPSGTGKSTLLAKLKQELPVLKWSVSMTTRKMRAGEVHGKDYHFTDAADFEAKIAKDAFIEWAKVHSNYYGTLKDFVDQGLARGDSLLFDLDVQGCDSIKRIYGAEAKVIFIEPPSVEELERRLLARATDSREVIDERIRNAKKELLRANDFDYRVVNDNFDEAYNKLKQIVVNILGSGNV